MTARCRHVGFAAQASRRSSRASFATTVAQDLIEYAFLAAFVGIAGYVALNAIGPTVDATYNSWLDPTTGTPSCGNRRSPGLSAGS